MRVAYFIMHGPCNYGADPLHTIKGLEQIGRISLMAHMSAPPSVIVVGTGRRHWEVYQGVCATHPQLARLKVLTSPFAGSADSLSKNGRMVLANGQEVDLDNYIGPGLTTCGFDAWNLVGSFPTNALILGGDGLFTALCLHPKAYGSLYKLVISDRKGHRVM